MTVPLWVWYKTWINSIMAVSHSSAVWLGHAKSLLWLSAKCDMTSFCHCLLGLLLSSPISSYKEPHWVRIWAMFSFRPDSEAWCQSDIMGNIGYLYKKNDTVLSLCFLYHNMWPQYAVSIATVYRRACPNYKIMNAPYITIARDKHDAWLLYCIYHSPYHLCITYRNTFPDHCIIILCYTSYS